MICFVGILPVQAKTVDSVFMESFSWKVLREPETDDDKNYFDKDKNEKEKILCNYNSNGAYGINNINRMWKEKGK